MKKGVIYLFFVLLFSCQASDTDDIFCTTEVKAGLIVRMEIIQKLYNSLMHKILYFMEHMKGLEPIRLRLLNPADEPIFHNL